MLENCIDVSERTGGVQNKQLWP